MWSKIKTMWKKIIKYVLIIIASVIGLFVFKRKTKAAGTTKVIKGGCNWCGLCGCYDPDGTNKWCPGLNFSLFDWDRQHPELGEKIIKVIKKAINWKRGDYDINGKIKLKDIGEIKFYLSKEGIQVSKTDKSCPAYNKNTRACILWDTIWLPKVCKTTPQIFNDKNQIGQWEKNHSSYCGFYWVK